MRLKGKIAIVTGGGGGLGEGICLCLAREGAQVVVSDLDRQLADTVAVKVGEIGSRSLAIKTDVSREDEVKMLVDQTIQEMGDLDILVCCAGISGYSNREASSILIEDLPVEQWDETFAVNMRGVFLCNRTAAPVFRKKNQGRIINIASIAGRKGSEMLPAYSASKAGVISFTQSMALQMAPHHVNVNAVCPGIIYTPIWERGSQVLAKVHPLFAGSGVGPKEALDMVVQTSIPFKTYQTPEDIGKAVVFLASEEAREITGQALNVCGGMYFS
ncbi:MAG: SDR family oxidoreductase [Deltaproteobacteria bacterium]|nr:SDR family oxidoreductase [Deltaproteobacteria bacterium]